MKLRLATTKVRRKSVSTAIRVVGGSGWFLMTAHRSAARDDRRDSEHYADVDPALVLAAG
ncbi:hypothetical protein FHX44_113192 [Pseudonocardia hierapolitana]|uniref:Uncharacterized protein n=1 Tax=Pseudonocardia hierapolitana TaxID=1128676 RepID=A0A561SR05_9PSEU|nr:hypothetical protein FHX44_113192 [Pseudonocardia hierapolitana]